MSAEGRGRNEKKEASRGKKIHYVIWGDVQALCVLSTRDNHAASTCPWEWLCASPVLKGSEVKRNTRTELRAQIHYLVAFSFFLFGFILITPRE